MLSKALMGSVVFFQRSGDCSDLLTSSFTLLYFCLPLIPLGTSGKEKDVCLLRVGMPGQGGCCTKIVSL